MNKIFIISGTAGSGKGSVWASLLKDPKYYVIKSCTTREKRSDSKDENKYIFLKDRNFAEKIKNNEFVEYEKVHDCVYGTLRSEFEAGEKSGKIIIMELDVLGALRMRDIYDNVVLIFIQPSDMKAAKERLRKRKTEDQTAIWLRISRYDMELRKSKKFDHIIINDNLKTAQGDLQKIIKEESEK